MNPCDEPPDNRFFGPATPMTVIFTLVAAPCTFLFVWVANVFLFLFLFVLGAVMLVTGTSRQIGTGLVAGSLTYVLVLAGLLVYASA